MRSLCEAEPDLERFTNQVVITDELREKFEVKIEVGDVEVDERYKNAYICKFYIEGREEYYLSASIKRLKEKRTGFVYEAKNAKGDSLDFFKKHGPQNIRIVIIENYPCNNEFELKVKENEMIQNALDDPSSLRKHLSRVSHTTTNKYRSGKIHLLWHKTCSKIQIVSTVGKLLDSDIPRVSRARVIALSNPFTFITSFDEIQQFEVQLLEDWPSNSMDELLSRQFFWRNVFPWRLQNEEVIERIKPQNLQLFLQDVDVRLQRFTNQICLNENLRDGFCQKRNVEDVEIDERYRNAYIYRLRIEGQPEFYFGSSIKKPADKRFSHICDAANGEPGRAYDYFRAHGEQNIIMDIVEYYPCKNEIELKLRENVYIIENRGNPESLNKQLAIKAESTNENRYKNGVIYAMLFEGCLALYLGSTIQDITKRKASHVAKAKSKSQSMFYQQAQAYGGVEEFDIVILEEWPCNNKRELEDREQFWKHAFPPQLLLNLNNAASSPEAKMEKRKLSNAAYLNSEQYKQRKSERKQAETAEQRETRLAKARTKTKSDAAKQKGRERAAVKRHAETAEERDKRLKVLRNYGATRNERSRNIKNAKRLVSRLNAGESFTPTSATMEKYGIHKNGQRFESAYLADLSG